MWFVFADDSEEKDPRRPSLGHLVGVGAALFPETSLLEYTTAIRSLRKELGIPPDVELKWSPPDGSWLKTAEGNAIRTPLRRRMLTLACDLRARSLSVVWDRGSVECLYPIPVKQFLNSSTTRYHCVWRAWMIMGWLSPMNQAVDRPIRRHGSPRRSPLTDEGTDYTKPERIVLPITTAPSHHVPHLQLADLIAGATTAAIAGNRYALELKPELMALAHRNFYGRVGGARLTLWPPELRNLFHWFCGDDVYIRLGAGAQLSTPGLPYEDSDGLSESS